MRKLISFDFDGTLDDEFGSIEPNPQKEEVQSLAVKYLQEGHEVIIITKRYGPENPNLGLKNEHLKVYDLAEKLGIKRVYFTNREWKFSQIINLGVDMHFENSESEIQLIRQVCEECRHECLVVPVEDPYWRDLVY